LSRRPFLARVGDDAGRPEGAERLRGALGHEGGTAGDATPGLELAWEAPPGAQPPGSPRVLCLIDGSIEGLDALGSELGVTGDDATVLAHGYERIGEAVLDRVRGAFAVLLWDRRARAGIAGRDQLGGRPIHYGADGRAQLVGTEMRDLLAVGGASRSPDRIALAHWLARRPPPGERTLIDGVSRLGAGGLIRLGDGRAEVHRWWEPRYREPLAASREDAVAQVRAAMAVVVGRALEGADDPAIMLSGGLDSACVAGLAGRLGSPAPGYSEVFPSHPEIDESDQIDRISDEVGIPVRRLTFAGGSALAAADRYARTWALPPSSPNWFVWEPLYEAVRQDGIDVLLDGEGGDELFGCSPRLLADLLVAGHLREAVSQARRIPGMGADPRPRRVRRAIAHYGMRAALPPALHGGLRRMRDRGRPTAPWLSAEAQNLLGPPERDAWKSLSGPRWWASLAYSLVDGPDRMAAQDEAGRAGGLGGFAVAHPWRDLELVELMLSLPPELSFDPDHDRPLAREAVRGLIPESVRLSGRKPVFNELLDDALRGPDSDELAGWLREPDDAVGWALRPGGVAAVEGPARSLVAWRIATACIWARARFG
jgi:asparagine synthase (glutamine-hydrolysing)